MRSSSTCLSLNWVLYLSLLDSQLVGQLEEKNSDLVCLVKDAKVQGSARTILSGCKNDGKGNEQSRRDHPVQSEDGIVNVHRTAPKDGRLYV